MNRFLWPLLGFFVLVSFLAMGLTLKPSEVPSPLINKPAPRFSLPQLQAPDKTFSPESMIGKVWVLNVWASWCAPCLEEHPVITELASRHAVSVVGMNYKDTPQNAIAWLGRNGNAFETTISDAHGAVGIDFGVYGVPETYLIDKAGIIRYKNTGPMDAGEMRSELLPLVQELEK